MNKKLHAFNCGESSLVTRRLMKYLFPLILSLMIGSAYGRADAQPSPPIVERDSDAAVLAHGETVSRFGSTWELDFYRNPAYDAGLSGNYTFLVMEPRDNPGVEAPLWVYLHGGGVGYFDEQGVYHATWNQTQDRWNHEETFDDLRKINPYHPIIDENGQLIDNTVTRRIKEADARTDTYEVGVGVADDELDSARYQLAFDKPTAVCGPITVTLWASCTTSDTDFFVVVSDLGPDGRVYGLQRGLLRASHRATDGSLSKWADVQGERVLIRPYHPLQDPEPLHPGKPYRFEIEVFPVGHVFRAGHKLSLSISQPPLNGTVIDAPRNYKYKYESKQPAGTVTIHRGADYPSSILLPVLPSLPPISENPPDVGDHVGIYLQNRDRAGVGVETP